MSAAASATGSSAPTISTTPTLSVAGQEGSVRVPRRYLRRLVQTRDEETVLVGLALPFLVHHDGAVVSGDGDRYHPDDHRITLGPGECLVTTEELAALVGRPYGGYAMRRALERLVEIEVIETRTVPGDAADGRLVIKIKRWGLLEGPYA